MSFGFYRYPAGGMFGWFCAGACEGPVQIIPDNTVWRWDKEKNEILKQTQYGWENNVLLPHIKTPPGPKPFQDAKDITIASEGLFTGLNIHSFGTCSVDDIKEEFSKSSSGMGEPAVLTPEKKEAKSLWQSIKNYPADKIGNGLKETFKSITDTMNRTLFATDCNGNSISVVSQFLNISRPLNITDNQYIMKIIHITQQVAMTLTIVLIAFYSIMHTTGYHNVDPIKFGIRMFFCLLAVQYLPWLMQDILNLNNTMVYYITAIEYDFGKGVGTATDIMMGAFMAVWTSFAASPNVGEDLLLLLLLVIIGILAILPILRIIMWWYIRLLKIFLAAIVGPILIMLASLPQTMEPAQKWIKNFIGSVFEQVFMALALTMTAIILGNIGDFGDVLGIEWFGKALLVFAAIYFLADVPDFSKQFIGGLSGGSSDKLANSMYNKGKKYSKSGWKSTKGIRGKAMTGAKTVAKGTAGVVGKTTGAAALGGLGLAAGASRSVTGGNLGVTKKILSKSKWAQKGSTTGYRVGGAGKNATKGFFSAVGSGDATKGVGKAGTLGATAGAQLHGVGKGIENFYKSASTSFSNALLKAKQRGNTTTARTGANASSPIKKNNLKQSLKRSANKRTKK